MKYGRVLENFLEMLAAERSVSSNTLCAYQTDIRTLLEFTKSKNLALEQITIEDLVCKITPEITPEMTPEVKTNIEIDDYIMIDDKTM